MLFQVSSPADIDDGFASTAAALTMPNLSSDISNSVLQYTVVAANTLQDLGKAAQIPFVGTVCSLKSHIRPKKSDGILTRWQPTDSARAVLLICGSSLALELCQAPSTGLLYFRAISNSHNNPEILGIFVLQQVVDKQDYALRHELINQTSYGY
ncbi:hypothetical protein B0H14DRAFT_2580613 [Mycena olivaceomarginata]|nr:hypothetical protein B0H14DRAFT_2580613 [Mycena olivaceomarginata]